jgi:hypothetical protein
VEKVRRVVNLRLWLVIAFMGVAVGAGPALAEDWEFTKWGMTVDEVTAAAGGKAIPCNEEDCRNMSTSTAWATLSMPAQSDGIDLIAVFDFDRKTERLTEIILRPKNERDNTRWALAMRLKLKKTYGPWKEEQWFGIPTWKWKWGDGEIRLTETTKYDMNVAALSYISKAGLDAIASQE